MVQAWWILENTSARHKVIHNFLQTTFKYNSFTNRVQVRTYIRQNLQLYKSGSQGSKEKNLHLHYLYWFSHYTTGQTGAFHRSDWCAWNSPRSHRPDRSTDRSDRPNQNRRAAQPAHTCATPRPPSLLVSVHHFPPFCIPADELDTSGVEINVRMPWNKKMWWQQTLSNQYSARLTRPMGIA